MIYTAPCVMFFMRARTLRGGPWKSRLFWALKGHEPIGECHLGPKTVKISRAQPLRNVQANITLREV